jgi:tRNA (adenine57-N1/adenine58-N1)-methyltransferase catalytic subunit
LTWNLHGTHAQEGDLVQLAGLKHRHFIIELKAGARLQTHRGIVLHDDLIGKLWGTQIFSHLGHTFFLLQPALGDLLTDTPRNTQILYPKEIGFVLVSMGIGPGQHVIEAGTGSGALTRALAFAIGQEGKIISYELKPEIQKTAINNLKKLGLADRVIFKQRDIAEGFDETGVDALFLDVQNPNEYMGQVRAALKPGGFFGCILPTVNQVSRVLAALRQHDFAFTEVVEILMRYYRTEPERLRPNDRMVGHTGFLVFSRPVLLDPRRKDEEELLESTNGLQEDNLEESIG